MIWGRLAVISSKSNERAEASLRQEMVECFAKFNSTTLWARLKIIQWLTLPFNVLKPINNTWHILRSISWKSLHLLTSVWPCTAEIIIVAIVQLFYSIFFLLIINIFLLILVNWCSSEQDSICRYNSKA